MPKLNESHFSIEDLVDMGLLTKDGRPTNNMTEYIWRLTFKKLKETSVPFIDGEKKRMRCKYIKAVKDENNDYLPDTTTQYQRYCAFINGILRDIRKGKVAYCYYLHQIRVLLRFHPNLHAKIKDFYWEVYLDE